MDAVTPLDRIRRIAITVEPTTGCDDCRDTGKVMTEGRDAEGLWFREEACPLCHGTGHPLCEAKGCLAEARGLVTAVKGGLGIARSYSCSDRAHVQQLMAALLEAQL